MSYSLRNMGTTAQFMPQLKRGVVRHTDTRTIVMVPDTNRSDANGDDVTGTAKFHFYISSDSNRNNWSLMFSHTPATTAMTSSKKFVGSMALNSDNDIFVAYQGTDNSLRLVSFNWNGSSYDAGVTQTVVAANAVTDRYRAIDIDVSYGTNPNPAIIVYEAAASSGQGANVKVYIRLDDNTTWRKALDVATLGSQFILAGSEDVSISWGADSIVTNVGRFAIYYTVTSTTGDSGDWLREYSFNVNTGTDNSATLVGSWATNLSQNVAAGSRKGWLFKNKTVGGTACWVFGGVVGQAAPYYIGAKLHHNSFTPVLNKTLNLPYTLISTRFQIYSFSSMSCNWSDQRLQFTFVGMGHVTVPTCMRSIVFRWSDIAEEDTCTSIDTKSRDLDNNYNLADGGIVSWGGANYISTGTFEYTTAVIYGASGNSVSSTPGVLPRNARVAIEDTLPAPSLVQPASGSTVAKNKVTFQVLSPSSLLYHQAHGKLELQIASDAGFTTNVQFIQETPATFYRTYESNNGTSGVSYYITYELTDAQKLFSGTWWYRARIKDDLGDVSAWTAGTFVVSHPPAALPQLPVNGATIAYTAGDIRFSWVFSDPEPDDKQTAYQIILMRLDTNVVVYDTGKVLSSRSAATITVASTLRDIPLSYQIRVWDTDDKPGAYSEPGYFTMSDPPVVVITTPVDAATITTALPTVAWSFAAGTRTQAAYRVVVTNLTANPDVVVGDSGWLVGTSTSYTFPAQILEVSKNYSFMVYVRDSQGMVANAESNLIGNTSFEGTVSGWTPTNATFTTTTTQHRNGDYAGRLVPAGGAAVSLEGISYPATAGHSYIGEMWAWMAAGYTSLQIIISWRNSSDVEIGTNTTTQAYVGPATWEYVSVVGTAPVGTAYARVRIAMTGTPTAGQILLLDDVALRHMTVDGTTSWSPPAAGAAVAVSTDFFKATITWTNANQDPNFVAWRVYRRYNKAASVNLDVNNTRNTWELLYETTQVQSNYTFSDYLYPFNKSVDYIVVQLADRFGSLIESNIPTVSNINIAGSRYYFVPAVPIGAIASFEASNVTKDDFTREIEQATLHVINRGRQVQQGDDLGYVGSYTLKLRNVTTARADREFIEMLAASEYGVYVRSPFGDVLYVSFGSPSFSRMEGVGTSDLGDLNVPYSVVISEPPITRTV